jgi:hypothetical protein
MAWTAKRVPGRNPLPRARLGLTNGGEHSASDLYLLSGLAPGGSAGAATTMNEIPALATSGLMNWVTLDKVTGVAPSPRHGLSATLCALVSCTCVLLHRGGVGATQLIRFRSGFAGAMQWIS